MMKRAHYIVKGKVQGVFYRKYAKLHADELGVKGWVRNLRNGDVEVEALATEELLGLFEEKLREGSPWSAVSGIEKSDVDGVEEFEGFEIR